MTLFIVLKGQVNYEDAILKLILYLLQKEDCFSRMYFLGTFLYLKSQFMCIRLHRPEVVEKLLDPIAFIKSLVFY